MPTLSCGGGKGFSDGTMIVMKFGGTSVEDAAALRNAAEIVLRHRERRPLVVVSACAGVTNRLIAAAGQAAEGNVRDAGAAVDGLRDRHLAADAEILGPAGAGVCEEISRHCDELRELLQSVEVLRELTPRTIDLCASYGERWSSLLLAGALRASGARAELVDAREVMITDDAFTRAAPALDAVRRRADAVLKPLLAAGGIVV